MSESKDRGSSHGEGTHGFYMTRFRLKWNPGDTRTFLFTAFKSQMIFYLFHLGM